MTHKDVIPSEKWTISDGYRVVPIKVEKIKRDVVFFPRDNGQQGRKLAKHVFNSRSSAEYYASLLEIITPRGYVE